MLEIENLPLHIFATSRNGLGGRVLLAQIFARPQESLIEKFFPIEELHIEWKELLIRFSH